VGQDPGVPRRKESEVRRSLGLRRSVVVAAALLVAGAVSGVSASGAFASNVSCGQTITQSTTLDSDLLGCQGDGIVIGADNITLDLGGHTISGNNFNYGVYNDGHTGVVIENGTVRTFYNGVGLDEANGNVVQNVTGESNSAAAISVYESNGNVIESNTSAGSNFGIVVTEGEGNVISDNSITRGVGAGIYLLQLSSENVVDRNYVRGMFFGALLFDSDNNEFTRNSFIENGSGATLLGADGADGNVFERNVSLLNSGDGFKVNVNSAGNVLERNDANRNGDDGIDVDDPAATLTRNSANNNEDHGIEAVAGDTDGGGNKASGNGAALQCVNISCK
jgi:parallel beta-helix repeat protein